MPPRSDATEVTLASEIGDTGRQVSALRGLGQRFEVTLLILSGSIFEFWSLSPDLHA